MPSLPCQQLQQRSRIQRNAEFNVMPSPAAGSKLNGMLVEFRDISPMCVCTSCYPAAPSSRQHSLCRVSICEPQPNSRNDALHGRLRASGSGGSRLRRLTGWWRRLSCGTAWPGCPWGRVAAVATRDCGRRRSSPGAKAAGALRAAGGGGAGQRVRQGGIPLVHGVRRL